MTELLRLSLADRSQLERFVHEHWNRGPCKLVTAPLISHQTGFDTVIGYSSVHAGEALVRVWAEDQFVYFPRDVIFIERPADRTFHGWADRVRTFSSVFAVNHLKVQLCGGWQVWDPLADLLRPIFEHAGLMHGGIEASLMSGVNHSLSHALHTWSKFDPELPAAHMVFAVLGRIRGTVAGQALSLEEGELLYAPKSAAPDLAFDGVGCALVINMRTGTADARADRMMRDLVIETASEARATCIHGVHRAEEMPRDLPPTLQETAAKLREYSTSEQLATEMFAAWCAYETGLGFADTPPPSRELELDGAAHIAARSGLAWREYGGRLFVAANGHLIRVTDHPAVRALLSALASGERATAEEFATRFGDSDGGPDAEQTYLLLQALFQRHAIAVAEI